MFLSQYGRAEKKAILAALTTPNVGFRIFKHINKNCSSDDIDAISFALYKGINVPFFIQGNDSIPTVLLNPIAYAVEFNFKINSLIWEGYKPAQILAIAYAYINGYKEITMYITPKLTPQQIELLEEFLKADINLFYFDEEDVYNVTLNYFTQGYLYYKDFISTLKNFQDKDFDYLKYLRDGFDVKQIIEIFEGIEAGVDISRYASKEISAENMRFIKNRLVHSKKPRVAQTDS